jgi:hypothetical protein
VRLFVSPPLFALVTALLSPISASAQPPAEGSVCDNLSGAVWGLCNAYCETMDCDSESAAASPQACSKVLESFTKHSDEPIPCAPVECPCFAPAAVDDLVEFCRDQSSPVQCRREIGIEPNGTGDVLTETDIVCFPNSVNNANLNAIVTSGYEDLFCNAENVPGTPDNDLSFPDLTLEQAVACSSILFDRFTMPPCDTIVTLP